MPIVDIQRQLVELGRIRTGDQVAIEGQAGKRRPRKLETFRVTSQREDLIREVARLYGGAVTAWEEGQWQVTITAKTLPIMLPPFESLNQWYEMWSGGGCQRRCDGERQIVAGGKAVDQPCECPPDKTQRAELAKDGTACKPTTRVNVILPELPGLGVWRLESHGYYAAVELAGAAEYLAMATSAGHRIPAHLRIVTRKVKRPGADGKPQTRTFTVPTIDIDVRPMDLLAGGEVAAAPQLAAGAGYAVEVNRRQRVARPADAPREGLPDEANFARPADPPFGPAPELSFAEGMGPVEQVEGEIVEESHVWPTSPQEAGREVLRLKTATGARFTTKDIEQHSGKPLADMTSQDWHRIAVWKGLVK